MSCITAVVFFLFLSVPLSAEVIGDGKPSAYPFFSRIQVLVDGKPRSIHYSLESRFGTEYANDLFMPPTPADIRVLKRRLLPQARGYFKYPKIPLWFKFSSPQLAKDLSVPPYLDMTYQGGRYTPETLQALGRLLHSAEPRLDGGNSTPLIVVNSYLYEARKNGSKPLPLAGFAVDSAMVKRINRSSGIELSLPGAMIIPHNHWFDINPMRKWKDLPLTVAHEIGHMLGLLHVSGRGNLMYESVLSGGYLNRKQMGWITRWLSCWGRI